MKKNSDPDNPTPELAWFITGLMENAVVPSTVTLSDLRRVLLDNEPLMTRAGEFLFRQDLTGFLNEVDRLIDHHGLAAQVRKVSEYLHFG